MADGKFCGQITLPPNFAERLLDLEIKVEHEPGKSSVLLLIGLYSVTFTQKAIEFYEAKKDPKYLYYHQRLQNLLKSARVLAILNNGKDSNNLNFSVEAAKMKIDARKRKNAKGNTTMPALRESELALKSHENSSNNSGHMVMENLNRQETTLQAKIQARRSRYANIVKKKQCNIDEYQKELEVLIENFVTKKIVIENNIRERYSQQIQEIKKIELNEDLTQRLLAEVDRKIEEEIRNASQTIEGQQKEAINALKLKI